MANTENQRVGDEVCVIGAGVVGLVATKNLLEQGLKVTTFERHEWLGGTWHVSQDGEQTTALEQTRLNTSKQASSYSDFPFPDELPLHPLAKDIQKYLESYAEHFNVLPHIQFSTRVDHVERDEASKKWLVYIKDEKTGSETCRGFDRVAVATGLLNAKRTPEVKGIEKFAGDVMHSREFKMPAKYEGKNVVVVGIGASGADSTSFLVRAKANKVYLSHRAQFFLLPRMINGKAFDHGMTRRVNTIMRSLFSVFPRLCGALMSKGLIAMRKKSFPWLNTHPSFTNPRTMDGLLHRVPFFSDDMAKNLGEGRIETVLGIKEITGPKSVTLADGKVLEDIDAIIFCSGYQYDFSVIRGVGDPTDPALAPDHHKAIESTPFYNAEDKFARLYKGFLSEQYPDSLAFLGHVLIMKPPILLYDVISMALASVWAGSYPLEPAEERRKDIDTQYHFLVETLKRGHVQHLGFRVVSTATYDWLNRAAGTGLTERLGYCNWESWKLWWKDSKLYYMLMDGFDTPAAYRLFDMGRGRKPWPGARARIEQVNEELKELGEAWKREQEEKKKNKRD
ncbi:flavin-binding monooxygenase-like-domain-containing protein [Thelonectria olida]|uniref:Flavin-binding monooxygenase-like-domain-containing protein n=1 Tax=Thelonectria olida TaxID=1576542 RepID=A0A9P9ANQ1_9HYPO|nr:flavin-binding monooxygenase-like-domain-containing protein [Thelonectria olida]